MPEPTILERLDALKKELSNYDQARGIITAKITAIEDKYATKCCHSIVLNTQGLNKCPHCGQKWTA